MRSVSPRPEGADRSPSALHHLIRFPAGHPEADPAWEESYATPPAGSIPSPQASCDIEWVEEFAYVLAAEGHDAARAAAAMLLDLVDELERAGARNVADLPAPRAAELLEEVGLG